MVISDLNHLLADVVLGADAALGTGPPGRKITGSDRSLGRHVVEQAPSTYTLLLGSSQGGLLPWVEPRGNPEMSKTACSFHTVVLTG